MTTTLRHDAAARRPKRSMRRLGIAGGIVGVMAAAFAFAAPVEAAEVRNELADEISAAAERAVAAFEVYEASDDLADYLTYARERTATARLAARELGNDEFAVVDAWKNTTLEHQRAVLAAMTQIGVPYRTNTSIEGEGFDCSGLTYYAWQESGTELVRHSGSQIAAAERVDADDAKAGDLVHYPGHVMMYLGVDGAVVHSVNTGRTVEIGRISSRRLNSVTFGDPIG